jgi:large subunit ribosomal protein L24
MAARLKIKKNDQVLVISGRDKGKRGRVIEVLTKEGKVIVEGVNIRKKAVRPNRPRGIAGGIVEKEAALDASNVMVIVDGQPTRIGYQILADGRKVRVSKKSGTALE